MAVRLHQVKTKIKHFIKTFSYIQEKKTEKNIYLMGYIYMYVKTG